MLIFSMLIQDLFHPPLSFFQLFVLYCKLFMGDKTGHPLDEIPQNVPFDTVRLRGVSGMLQLPYGGLVLMRHPVCKLSLHSGVDPERFFC